MPECIGAFDIGGLMGYAILPADGEIVHGVLDLVDSRLEGAGMRYVRYEQELNRLHSRFHFTRVVFEEVRNHESRGPKGQKVFNVTAAHRFGGYTATLMAWCEKAGVPYLSVPVQKWKKSLTNMGNAGKPLVKSHVEKLGFNPCSYDSADAIGILLWAEREFSA